MKVYGLDLSTHNGGLDFQAIKNAGNDFVILRAGYGSAMTQKDTRFERYYKQAKAVGLKVGAYLYSYAMTASQGTDEAKVFYEWLKGKTFEYPVFIDMEDKDGYKKNRGMPSNATLSAICDNFCKYMESKGYYVGIYANESWFKNQLKEVVKSGKYDLWVANWGTDNGTLQADKSSTYNLHQFTSMYKLDGKRFDRNVCYFDYPTLIKSKGFNGYKGGSVENDKPAETPKPNPMPTNKYKVGDVVTYDTIYVSSTSKVPLRPLYTSGKITKVHEGARNPYQLGGTGFINDDCIKGNTTVNKTITKGDKVKVTKAINYDNGKSFTLYYDTYDVIEVKGNRAVIGIGNNVTSAIDIKYLKKV